MAEEIGRGVSEVSGLPATPTETGWVAVTCASPAMARWLSEAVERENVQARAEGGRLLIPAAAHYTLDGEIKSVITVVAKTTDYWFNHMPADARRAIELGHAWTALWARLRAAFK